MPASDNNPDSNLQRDGDIDGAPPFLPKRLIPLSPTSRRIRDRNETRIGWKMAALGWEFSSQVVAGVALGWGADYFFPSLGHWGIICGAGVGLLVGITTFLRSALKLNNELEGSVQKPKKGTKNG